MTPLFTSPVQSTIESDLEVLNMQVAVGSALLANPVILKFLELQITLLNIELVEITRDPNGNAERFKDAVLFRTQQIAAYRFIHDMASKHTDIVSAYNVRKTQVK